MYSRSSLEMNNDNARLLDTDGLRAYLSLGRDNAVKLGNKIGARVQVGRRVLWDKKRLDEYLDSLLED